MCFLCNVRCNQRHCSHPATCLLVSLVKLVMTILLTIQLSYPKSVEGEFTSLRRRNVAYSNSSRPTANSNETDGDGGVGQQEEQGGNKSQAPDWVVIIFYNTDIFTFAFLGACVLAVILVALLVGVLIIKCCNNQPSQKLPEGAFNDYSDYAFREERSDGKLARSAQMYHYQHQKQQIIAAERASDGTHSDEDSDNEDTRDGNYTVYECPGLAPVGEMEVKNPIFDDEDCMALSTTSSNDKNEKIE